MFRLLFVTFFGTYRGDVDPAKLGIAPAQATDAAHAHADDAHEEHAHAPAWLMNAPVALLIVPTIFAGWLMFGGENSLWAKFFSSQFVAENLGAPAIPEILTTLIVLVVVIVGFAVAYMRYATKPALANAVDRLREESVRMPDVLVHAFYIDAALDVLFVRSSMILGNTLGRFFDPKVIDATVREVAHTAQWLGTLMRSFQTGLVRAYAVLLVFGAACFLAYYALAGGWH